MEKIACVTQVYTEVYLLYIKLGGVLSLWVLLAFVNAERRDGDIYIERERDR